jgi:glutaminyl-peptide cyclotransferase
VDMIGDKDLGILKDSYSSAVIGRLVWQVAAELGYSRHFLNQATAIEDDHIPFVRAGVAALDLIDFSYGADHSWWHTAEDTMDKLSARSLQVVGDVLLESIRRLEQ